MENFINTLSNAILGKQMANCHSGELESLAQKYPYAAALQLLYAKKLAGKKQDIHKDQSQKTLLYYSNPLFINFLLGQDSPKALPMVEGSASPATPVGMEATENNEEDLTPLPEFKIEAIDPATAQLSYTPYHTVDYFAAQGIKFSEEQNSADRFGTQLKSFTAWLKQMKRLPGASKNIAMTAFEEKNIEQMAATSVKGENAITETMAEVWEKQGDKQKAIHIYQKLSLQIPAKSAYFAAKIDHLKK